jgi:large subunit ribosomal protein L14e
MYETGRLCVKTAGRDAGKYCVIIDAKDDHMVMIDGQTRRRTCNIKHLEPLDKVLKISKGASHSKVVSALKKENIKVVEKKTKQKPIKLKREKTEKKETKSNKQKRPEKKSTKKSKKK